MDLQQILADGWFVVSDRSPLAWSDDNKRIFLGMIPQTATPDSNARRSGLGRLNLL
jgi:hypothetical protein